MKAILIIIAALGIQISTLIANNIGDVVTPTTTNEFVCPECPILIPVIPLEAFFGEMIEFDLTLDLNPVVPMEATFDDGTDFGAERITNDLAPVFPSQADFDEDEIELIIIDSSNAPVVPSTADFNDSL